MRHNLFFILFICAFLPHIGEAPIWVSVVAFILTVHAYLASSGYLSRWSLRLTGGLSVLAGLAVFLQFKTLLGPESATSLLILLAALKLEELRTERDGVIFLFLVSLLVMYYLLFSQTLLATLYMVVMCVVLLIGFVIAHTPREHLKEVLSATPKLVSKDLLLSLPLFLLLFAFFPRFSMPWATRMMGETGVVGFSERLSPGAMASLARSQEPAFRVLFNDGSRWPIGTLYWRGMVMAETDGWAWWSNEVLKNTDNQSKNINRLPKTVDEPTSILSSVGPPIYEVHLEPKFGKRLFALDRTQTITWRDTKNFNPIRIGEQGTFSTRFTILSRVGYLGHLSAEHGASSIREPEGSVEAALRIPEPSVRMQAFIQELKAKYSTDRERAEGLLEHFRTKGFRYSLNTPEMKTIDEFFFKEKIGFCEHYASSFASVLRWVGVPSRVVSGFQGGQYNDFSNFLLVRDQDAHSWVEVYLDGTWQRIDPTYAVNPTRITTGDIAQALPGEVLGGGTDFLVRGLAKVQMAYAALEQRYNQFILNYNADAQEDLLPATWGIKQKRWVLLGICIVGCIGALLFLAKVSSTRAKTDPFQNFIITIQKDMALHHVFVRPQDSVTRLMQAARQRWPAIEAQFDQIEEKYHAFRFQKSAESKDKKSRQQVRELSKHWAAIRATFPTQPKNVP